MILTDWRKGEHMRKVFLFLCAFGLLSFSLMAENYYVDHVAEENWTTSITVYNTGPDGITFDLHRWDTGGAETVMTGFPVPGFSSLTLTNADFGYDGTAIISTASDTPVVVKLSYRYRDSHSLCEFFLGADFKVQNWMLPNPYQSHFDWFGMALANFNATTATVTLKAYQAGALVATEVRTIPAHTKIVNVSSGFWNSIQYPDVDLVMIDSDVDIPAPVSITGNTEQDRHVFFQAQYEIQQCISFLPHNTILPHVAEENWTTQLTAYNNQAFSKTFTYSSWFADGSPDVVDQLVTVPANGSMTLQAGMDFDYGTTASISTLACMQFKLSYRYQESQSLCEFFLHSGEGTVRWIIPNSIQEWFDWFGLAMSNPTDDEIIMAMDAYKNGQYLGTSTRMLEPHTKAVGLASDFWTNLSTGKTGPAAYDDIDMVVLRSSYPLANPLSITGNEEQDRHVFFLAAGGVGDESEFPDPSFRAFVLANYDTDHDGAISQAEADVVTTMDTPGTYGSRGTIRDLTGIGQFRNLTYLDCSNEQLSWLPDLSGLTNLHSLYAVYNYLVTVPDLSALISLNTLSLSGNSISHVPDLTALTWMTNLFLDDNELTSVPNVSGLANLMSLDVSGNHLSTLPDLSASAGTFLSLAFGSNDFTTFPDIASLSELHFLDCSYNQLATMPDLSTHPNIVTLYCHENQFTSLPGLASLTQLTMLECHKNQLTDLSGIAGLTNLYSLSCRDNLLTSLPDMSSLTQMKYLICGNNTIYTIPGLSALTGMTTLHCNGTNISDLSPITGMPSLAYLKCENCPITTIPDLSGLDNLQMLTCSNCLLTDIPDVTDCDAIWYFNCSNNFFGSDDCATIQATEAMGLSYFNYNPQNDGSTLTCP